MNARIVNCVWQVQLFRWVEKDDGVQELQTECGYHGHILALYMQVRAASRFQWIICLPSEAYPAFFQVLLDQKGCSFRRESIAPSVRRSEETNGRTSRGSSGRRCRSEGKVLREMFIGRFRCSVVRVRFLLVTFSLA